MPQKVIAAQPKLKPKQQLERPKLYKVILNNDDYTPRQFVTIVLKAVFRMSEETGNRVMMTAHKFGSAVVVVCTRDIAETKAKEANDLAKEAGFPLLFTTEPEDQAVEGLLYQKFGGKRGPFSAVVDQIDTQMAFRALADGLRLKGGSA